MPAMEDGSFNLTYALWIAAGIVISALTSCVAGHRIHLWVAARSPLLARSLPTDFGAWTGLLAGIAIAVAVNAEELTALVCAWREFGICPKADLALWRILLAK